MYSKIFGSSYAGIRGTYHAPGLDHVYYVNNNGNTGYLTGQILRIRVTPLEQVCSGTMPIVASPATQINLDTGPFDIQWTTGTGGVKKLQRATAGTLLYKYPSAPSGGLASIDPASLAAIPFATSGSSTYDEPGTGNNYYAVRLSASGPYAVVRVYFDATDNKTKIQWITYKLNTNPDIIGMGYSDPRDVLFSSDMQYAYVSGLDEYGTACVFKVPNIPDALTPDIPRCYTYGSPSAFAVNDYAQQLDDPQQLALHNGKIYVVDAVALWSIDLDSLQQEQVLPLPNGGMGLLIDDNGEAIITDRQGSILKADLTDTVPSAAQLPPPLATLDGVSGFLSWSSPAKTGFYAPVLDPDNKVFLVDLENNGLNPILNLGTLTPPVLNPWSVEAISATRMLIASDMELGTLNLEIVSNELVLGIGFVPFTYIIQNAVSTHRGHADTTPAPSYFFQVNKVPFGGTLHLLMNHSKANTLNITHYRVTFKHVATGTIRTITDPINDFVWKQVGGTPAFYPSATVSTGLTPAAPTPASAFPVRNPNDLWYNPYWAAVLNTSTADNGLNEITFTFFKADGTEVVAEKKTYVVFIDNTPCGALIKLPRIGNPPAMTYPTVDCGCITYVSKNDKVELDFIAWQALGYGTYNLAMYRGGVHLPALFSSGTVDTSALIRTKSTTSLPASPTFKVGHLLGNCNVAQVMFTISVPRRVTTGYTWLYGASNNLTVTLVPSSTSMSTPWVDPGG